MAIYLDHAAATPLDKQVLAAMEPYFIDKFYNPSALYLAAKTVKADIAMARQSIAKIIGAKPSEIVFTSGGTEANNLAIQGVLQAWPGSEILVSSIEHESILEPAAGHDVLRVDVSSSGRIDLADLQRRLSDKTVLVSVMYANNEIGTIQALREIAGVVSLARARRLKDSNRLPIYLHTDATQAANYLDLQVASLGVDMMTVNGGKIYGPKQVGFLYVKTGTKLKAQVLGGGQERGLRSGTENVAGIVGLASALSLAASRRKDESKRLMALRQYFIKELTSRLPQAVINGSLKHRLPNNIHVTIPGIDNERVIMALDERGIMCAAGSACSASSEQPSHVLTALGLSDTVARSSLRFTMGVSTTEADIDATISALAQICL